MLALRYEGELALREVPEPVPGPGEALIEVHRAGFCATDRQIVAGYAGFEGTLGHEMTGTVVRCPSEPRWEGRRVVPEINLPCGHCSRCRSGRGNHCGARRVLGIRGKDGAFARYVTMPTSTLHAVPDEVTDEQAVFAEPLAAALRIAEQVEVGRETRATVLGDGKLGLLIAWALQGAGARTTVVGRHPRKLALAAASGVRTCTAEDPRPREQDVVVDATGSPEGVAAALGCLRPQGTLVLKSTLASPPSLDWSAVVVQELRIVGSRCGPIAQALEVLARGTVDPRGLIDAVYPMRQGLEAFAKATERGVLKVLLDPRSG